MPSAGILFSDELDINFKSNNTFEHNLGSAIYITAGRVHVLPSATLVFRENRADRGAGVALMGYAGITAHERSQVIFMNNTATDVGGAIYYGTIDKLDYVNSRRCFIRYNHIIPPDQWETQFIFINNVARNGGNNIYASSLLPCARATFNNSEDSFHLNKVFRWKSFHYVPEYRPLDIRALTLRVSD